MAETKAQSNFPGFQYTEDVLKAWLEAVTAYGRVWNDAWGEMRNGQYELKHAFRDMTSVYDANYQAVEQVFKYPGQNANVPAWAGFELPSNANQKRVTLTRRLDNGFVPAATPLCRFDGVSASSGKIKPAVNPIDSQTLHITIPPIPDEGQYIAFVYDKKDPSPPLVIVFVVVSPPPGEKPVAEAGAKKKRVSKKVKAAKKVRAAGKKATKKA